MSLHSLQLQLPSAVQRFTTSQRCADSDRAHSSRLIRLLTALGARQEPATVGRDPRMRERSPIRRAPLTVDSSLRGDHTIIRWTASMVAPNVSFAGAGRV